MSCSGCDVTALMRSAFNVVEVNHKCTNTSIVLSCFGDRDSCPKFDLTFTAFVGQ